MKIKRSLSASLLLFATLLLPWIPTNGATIQVGNIELPQDQLEVKFQPHPLSLNPDTAQNAPGARPYIQIGCIRYPVTLDEDGRVLSATRGNLWTDGVVYYQFDPAVRSLNRQRFIDAAAQWVATADLTFIEGTGSGSYIYIINASGNYSFLGEIGGPQELGMYNWSIEGIIVHEIGHALGLIHEHQRADRDSFIQVLDENIIPGYENQFIIDTGSSSFGDYDFESIMHYPKDAFGLFGNTLEPLPAFSQFLDTMGQRLELSESDKLGMENMYGALSALRYESHTIDDDNFISAGNDDGIVDPGETIEMPLTIANRDTVLYTSVEVEIDTNDIYTTITKDRRFIVSIAGQSSGATLPFQFDVDPTCPPGHVINFQVGIHSGTETWGSSFTITVSSLSSGIGSLSLASTVIHDGTGGGLGNKNGFINSGESIDLDVTLTNEGDGEVTNIRSTLRTLSPFVTITDDYEIYSNIDAGASGTTRTDFDFDVAPLTPSDHVIEFQMDVLSDQGDYSFFFSIPVNGLPNLVYSSHKIFDGQDRLLGVGNANTMVEAGESIDMYISISNTGLGDSSESRTDLSSSSPWITFDDNRERHAGMTPGNVKEAPGDYEFDVSPNAPKGTDIIFTLTMTSDEGVYVDTFTVTTLGDPVTPAITRTITSGGNIKLEWDSENGLSYYVWTKASLTDTEWTFLETFIGNGGKISYEFPESAGSAFYRVERVDPNS